VFSAAPNHQPCNFAKALALNSGGLKFGGLNYILQSHVRFINDKDTLNMAKVAINGLGRIGRATLKLVMETPELELVGVNDIADVANIAYLIQYDTVYGRYEHDVKGEDGKLTIGDLEVPYFSERNPADLPWSEHNIDIVFECTGFFTDTEGAGKHLEAGAKYVIVSGPTKSKDMPTVVHGVNTQDGLTSIISCASCTTNNVGPVMEIINRHFGVENALMTTIHAYTATQAIVDGPDKKDFRRGRAGAQNFVPTSTGAAIAVTKAMPELEGKFDGVAVRAPIPVGSLSDITLVVGKATSAEEINATLRAESETERYKDVFGVTDEPLVSSDIIGLSYASMADLAMTQVVGGTLVKIMTWYDNEWSYTSQMIRQAVTLASESEKIPS
jgi:glyceraldehyde 3-phosphate dehydrogenase